MITIQRTDTGINFVVQITDEQSGNPLDLSQATNIQFIFRRPDKTVAYVNGSLLNSGTDGKVSYTSVSGDLDLSGLYKFQVSYKLSGSTKLTSWGNFQITSNLSDLT